MVQTAIKRPCVLGQEPPSSTQDPLYDCRARLGRRRCMRARRAVQRPRTCPHRPRRRATHFVLCRSCSARAPVPGLECVFGATRHPWPRPSISPPWIGPSMMYYGAPPPSSHTERGEGVRRSDRPCPTYSRPVHDSPRTLTCPPEPSRAPLRASRADHCPSRLPSPTLPSPSPPWRTKAVSQRRGLRDVPCHRLRGGCVLPEQGPATAGALSLSRSQVRAGLALKSLFRPGQLPSSLSATDGQGVRPLTGRSHRPCRAYPSGFVPGQLRILRPEGECVKLRTLQLGPRLERVRQCVLFCGHAMVSGWCVLAQPIQIRLPPREARACFTRLSCSPNRVSGLGGGPDCSKARRMVCGGRSDRLTILFNGGHQSRHEACPTSRDANGWGERNMRAC
ncbi:hypothetical protein OH77DRAFT_358302 [Trametes cingulata]|nr:hypothetical protein OH77DRAFT_358302 [Trametes cingulata]